MANNKGKTQEAPVAVTANANGQGSAIVRNGSQPEQSIVPPTPAASAAVETVAPISVLVNEMLKGTFGKSTGAQLVDAIGMYVAAQLYANTASEFSELKKLCKTGASLDELSKASIAARAERDMAVTQRDNAKRAFDGAVITAETPEDYMALAPLKIAVKSAETTLENAEKLASEAFNAFAAVDPEKFTSEYNRYNNTASTLRANGNRALMAISKDRPELAEIIKPLLTGDTLGKLNAATIALDGVKQQIAKKKEALSPVTHALSVSGGEVVMAPVETETETSDETPEAQTDEQPAGELETATA